MPQCPNAPTPQCTNAPMPQCTNVPMYQCTNVPMYQCPMHQCPNVNVPMYQCSNALMPPMALPLALQVRQPERAPRAALTDARHQAAR
eukprot:scaffold15467_cov35-Phaeocystis_antarctica.AAC.1